MMQKSDGMNYAPKGKPNPVVKPGEFVFSAIALDHGHIYGMCNGLIEAGATLKYVYDPDPAKVERFLKAYPQAIAAESEEQVLNDPETKLIAGVAVTSQRCALGLRAMAHGLVAAPNEEIDGHCVCSTHFAKVAIAWQWKGRRRSCR